MTHWRTLSRDPNAPEVRAYLRDTLLSRRGDRIPDARAFLEQFTAGRSVLDIGVVQHTLGKADSPDWRHGILKRNARRLVGVDILAPEVAALNARGFDVRLVDATSDADLGERFDRVVVGDVIEHVDDPVRLLRFGARHLTPDGRMLVTTPNPFFLGYLLAGLREKTFVANAEHVTWITPSMALELAHRAGIDLVAYHHVQGEGKTPGRRAAALALGALGLRDAEPFTAVFWYVFGPAAQRG
jgi:SAM-dependent methyltransferase